MSITAPPAGVTREQSEFIVWRTDDPTMRAAVVSYCESGRVAIDDVDIGSDSLADALVMVERLHAILLWIQDGHR